MSYLGYAIIQIPDFLLSLYGHIERWLRIRRQALSNHGNDVWNNSSIPEPLPQKKVKMVSKIPRLVTQTTKQNDSLNQIPGLSEEIAVLGEETHYQTQTSDCDQKIAELRKETNVKIEKLKKMLEEINRQLKKSACNDQGVFFQPPDFGLGCKFRKMKKHHGNDDSV